MWRMRQASSSNDRLNYLKEIRDFIKFYDRAENAENPEYDFNEDSAEELLGYTHKQEQGRHIVQKKSFFESLTSCFTKQNKVIDRQMGEN